MVVTNCILTNCILKLNFIELLSFKANNWLIVTPRPPWFTSWPNGQMRTRITLGIRLDSWQAWSIDRKIDDTIWSVQLCNCGSCSVHCRTTWLDEIVPKDNRNSSKKLAIMVLWWWLSQLWINNVQPCHQERQRAYTALHTLSLMDRT